MLEFPAFGRMYPGKENETGLVLVLNTSGIFSTPLGVANGTSPSSEFSLRQ